MPRPSCSAHPPASKARTLAGPPRFLNIFPDFQLTTFIFLHTPYMSIYIGISSTSSISVYIHLYPKYSIRLTYPNSVRRSQDMLEGPMKKATATNHEDFSIYSNYLSAFDLTVRAYLQARSRCGCGCGTTMIPLYQRVGLRQWIRIK